MKALFPDHRKYAYVLILTLSLSSLFFAVRPTGMVTSVSTAKLAETALLSDAVRQFIANNPDFTIRVEELTPQRLAELNSPLYSGLPETRIYQMIIDSTDNALIVLLNDKSVFKTWEVTLEQNLVESYGV